MRPAVEVALQRFYVEMDDGRPVGIVEQSNDGRWVALPRGVPCSIGVYDRPVEANAAVLEHARARPWPRRAGRMP